MDIGEAFHKVYAMQVAKQFCLFQIVKVVNMFLQCCANVVCAAFVFQQRDDT